VNLSEAYLTVYRMYVSGGWGGGGCWVGGGGVGVGVGGGGGGRYLLASISGAFSPWTNKEFRVNDALQYSMY
jgi:hypothetical protein